MHKTDDFKFAAVDGLKALELPYGNGDLSTVVLLPDEIDGLAALEQKLSYESLTRWTNGLQKRKVQVFLPRFKLTSDFSLSTVLAAMGMPLAFDEAGRLHGDQYGGSTLHLRGLAQGLCGCE